MDSSRDIVRKLRENRILNERRGYEKMERNELIKLAQNGDQLALETLVKTHQDMIINYSKKYHLDTGDFDDIKQLVTIAFWEAVQKWDMTGNFEAYAGMIIKRKMADELRKEDAEKTKISTKADALDAPVGSDDEGGELTLGASIQSKSLSPEEEYLGRDGARKLMKFMKEELSDVERKVILKYIQGYKVSEISEEENMKYKTVENALMRVKNKIADYMRNMRESKKIKLSEGSIFSEEEKQILTSLLKKIDDPSSMNESLEDATSSELEDILDGIADEVDDIVAAIENTSNEEEYNNLLSKLDDLDKKVYEVEDYTTDDEDYIYKKCQEVHDMISKAERTEAENLKSDSYAEVGMSRKDFF